MHTAPMSETDMELELELEELVEVVEELVEDVAEDMEDIVEDMVAMVSIKTAAELDMVGLDTDTIIFQRPRVLYE